VGDAAASVVGGCRGAETDADDEFVVVWRSGCGTGGFAERT
jgi:hypothetical protein